MLLHVSERGECVCVGGCLSHVKFILGSTSGNDCKVEL